MRCAHLFYLYIIFVVVVFVKDEFKDKDDTTRDYCINHCKYGRVFFSIFKEKSFNFEFSLKKLQLFATFFVILRNNHS